MTKGRGSFKTATSKQFQEPSGKRETHAKLATFGVCVLDFICPLVSLSLSVRFKANSSHFICVTQWHFSRDNGNKSTHTHTHSHTTPCDVGTSLQNLQNKYSSKLRQTDIQTVRQTESQSVGNSRQSEQPRGICISNCLTAYTCIGGPLRVQN